MLGKQYRLVLWGDTPRKVPMGLHVPYKLLGLPIPNLTPDAVDLVVHRRTDEVEAGATERDLNCHRDHQAKGNAFIRHDAIHDGRVGRERNIVPRGM